jgi:superfamily I DNA/RNA helicase
MFEELNEEQKQAVVCKNSAIAIIAGPGTGKTKTLVARLEYLLVHKKIPASQILALTFTKKAAAEIQDRLLVREKPFVGTFHALALYLLQIKPTIISAEQQREIVNKKELLQISVCKNTLQETDLVRKYNQKLKDLGLIDYDDLLLSLYGFLKETRLKIAHTIVDEFQDTSPIQYEILKSLRSQNYFIIGDPKQSIYSFRGTDGRIFKQFEKDFNYCVKITLTQNYRSEADIIRLYQSLYKDVVLKATKRQPAEIFCIETLNEYSEAEWIVNFIKDRAGGLDLRDASEATANFSDFAVLYRTHHLSKVLQRKFDESGIPFQVVGSEYLTDNQQIVNFKINCVKLLTMHASKGLEFEYVFVCGMEEGILPTKTGDYEEEKRLFYVALSRAKKGLVLTYVQKRNKKSQKRSEFLSELNEDILPRRIDPHISKIYERIKKARRKKAQMALF